MQQWCSRQIIQKEQISLNLKAWEMMEEFKWDGNWWHAYHQTYLQTSSWRNVILAHCPMQEWLIQKQKPDSEVTLPSGFNSSPNEEWVRVSASASWQNLDGNWQQPSRHARHCTNCLKAGVFPFSVTNVLRGPKNLTHSRYSICWMNEWILLRDVGGFHCTKSRVKFIALLG